ncbi:Mov34/MPN/PAD-1 family protein [Acidihalobacter yilgarnensis]|uniref:Mov34/MPN/PAD-1 family protein n=1 Tax=Acidihalobacter yilgarnensis TaxID=2819280 RepID=UPI0009F2AB49|nr:Mov34/MPN/PAD-1 family protein [Acidihalobacter yilgarnensis]
MIRRNSEILWLPSNLLIDHVYSDALKNDPDETGGMLLGYVNREHRVITALVDAGPKAVRSSYFMKPDDIYQQQKLQEHFELTEGRETYIGEWHSHPNSPPEMSKTDRKTLHRVTIKATNLPALPVMVILGSSDGVGFSKIRAYRRNSRDHLFLGLRAQHFSEMLIKTY